MEIPDDVLNKIRVLCRGNARKEWSGILFYEVKGSIRDVSKMKVILRDIFLMDIGNATYTSFDWDGDIVSYRMDNPESLDWLVGHIHSHNTMNVFFSDTDWGELNDNCTQHNFYLSVIVNNYLDISAKIAFTAESQKFVCKDESGKDYTMSVTGAELNPVMFVYDVETDVLQDSIIVPDNFTERMIAVGEKVDKAIEAAAKASKKKAEIEKEKNYPSQAGYKGNTYKDFKESNKSPFPDWSKSHKKEKGLSAKDKQFFQEFINHEEEVDFTEETTEQKFATYVLRLGTDDIENDELVDALEDAEVSEINPDSFAKSILESYGAFYERFFDKDYTKKSDEAFIDVLEEVISIFTGFEKDYSFLTPIITSLTSMGVKFEAFSKEDTKEIF